jgi:hypothetical protein
MIPRPGPRVEQLPPLKLYREDLDKLVSLFREHCQQVTFGDEEHVYESLDEMTERTPVCLRSFNVEGLVPHAGVLIRGSHSVPLTVQRSTIWTVERNQKSDILFLSVKDYLAKRRWLSRIVLRYTLLTIGTVLLTALFFSKPFLRTHDGNDFPYNLAVLFAFGLLVVGVLMNTKRASYITLNLRSKSQSFWEHNGNSIILALISVAFGVIGTLVTTWLKNRWAK